MIIQQYCLRQTFIKNKMKSIMMVPIFEFLGLIFLEVFTENLIKCELMKYTNFDYGIVHIFHVKMLIKMGLLLLLYSIFFKKLLNAFRLKIVTISRLRDHKQNGFGFM